jgi:hypothetical protein
VSEIKVMMYAVLIVFFLDWFHFVRIFDFVIFNFFVICDVESYHNWLCFVLFWYEENYLHIQMLFNCLEFHWTVLNLSSSWNIVQEVITLWSILSFFWYCFLSNEWRYWKRLNDYKIEKNEK